MKVRIVIPNQPCSKANSRRLVTFGKRPALIKSKPALEYERTAKKLLKPIKPLLEGDLIMTATLYYASRRPDLDESIVMDVLQGIVYKNDRQIKIKHIYHALDKDNPRAEVLIETIQESLELDDKTKVPNPKTKGDFGF